MIYTKCLICGKKIKTYLSRIKEGKSKYCSKKCMAYAYKKTMLNNTNGFKKRHIINKKGKNSKYWKGDKKKHNGYWYIESLTHPRSHSSRVKQAVIIAEQCLGRLLKKQEVVHHINNVKDDDRPKNLYIFSSQSKHCSYHHLKNKPTLQSNLL